MAHMAGFSWHERISSLRCCEALATSFITLPSTSTFRFIHGLILGKLVQITGLQGNYFTIKSLTMNKADGGFYSFHEIYLCRTGSQTMDCGSCFIQLRKFRASMNSWPPAFSKQDLTLGSTLVPPKAWTSPNTRGTWKNVQF